MPVFVLLFWSEQITAFADSVIRAIVDVAVAIRGRCRLTKLTVDMVAILVLNIEIRLLFLVPKCTLELVTLR